MLPLTVEKITDSSRSPRRVRSISEYLSNAPLQVIDLTITENVKIK